MVLFSPKKYFSLCAIALLFVYPSCALTHFNNLFKKTVLYCEEWITIKEMKEKIQTCLMKIYNFF